MPLVLKPILTCKTTLLKTKIHKISHSNAVLILICIFDRYKNSDPELMNFLYFDPGLGAMIVQAVVAAAAGILLFSKNVMYKVKSFLGLVKDEEDSYNSIDVEEQDDEKHG